MILARREDGTEVDDDAARVDLDLLVDWLSVRSYWAAGRARADVERSLPASWCFGAYAGPGPGAPMVGFARAVTDRATFAWLCDVYVEDAAQGDGIGTWLVRTATEALLAAGVPRVLLATRDAHEVYRRAGYETVAVPNRFMEIDLRPTRSAAVPEDSAG